MKKLFILFITIFSLSANAAYAPLAPSLTVGNRVFTDTTNLIVLYCFVSSGNYCSFRKANGSSGYQVTAGKTLTIWAYRIESSSTSVSNGNAMYTDNDMGFSSAASLTNPFWLAGTALATVLSNAAPSATASITSGQKEFSAKFDIPATKYAGWGWSGQNGSLMVTAFGYEN